MIEEQLVAYVDGELDAAGRADVEAAAAADPAVAARLAAHRALRERLSGVFGAVLTEPVPQALIDTARAAPPRPSAVVLPFAPRTKPVAPSRQWWLQAGVMAACLVAGIALTLSVTGGRGDIVSQGGRLMARGALARALSMQLAADDRGPVRIALTFRDHAGAVCRTFATEALDGMACRDGGDWRIDATARGEGKSDYRQAASPLITAAAEDRAAGDAFDATAEKQARDGGWKPGAPAK